ncbi:MAG: Ku protein [Phycisphaerales bacterium]
MPPRAMWTGQLRLSLVSIGVRMYAATESSNRVAMNQLHKDCHQRIKNQTVCPTHGPIPRSEIVKGYEYEKDSYVIIEDDDLQALRLESKKTIDLVQFVDAGEIDPMFIDSPYFIGPDGPVAEEPYRVIREAMRESGKVGIGKLVMSGRERMVALDVHGKGFVLTTLRFATEVRQPDAYFNDIKEDAVEAEQVELARSIIKTKTSEFEPDKFADKYAEAFFEVVKQKVAGEAPIIVEEDAAPSAFNFMEALKQSVADVEAAKSDGKKKRSRTTPKKPAAKSVSKKDEPKQKRKRA